MAKKVERKQKPIVWTGNRPPMKHSDFYIGCEFLIESGRWRCTDVGTRTVAAIKLDHDDDPRWYEGPPYAVVERVFDEFDIEGCEKAPKQRSFDATGMTALKLAALRQTKRTPRRARRAKG